jgi:hypothetical protein
MRICSSNYLSQISGHGKACRMSCIVVKLMKYFAQLYTSVRVLTINFKLTVSTDVMCEAQGCKSQEYGLLILHSA